MTLDISKAQYRRYNIVSCDVLMIWLQPKLYLVSQTYDSRKSVVSEMYAIQFVRGGGSIIVSTSHATKLSHVNRSFALCNGIPIPDSGIFLLMESGIVDFGIRYLAWIQNQESKTILDCLTWGEVLRDHLAQSGNSDVTYLSSSV